MDKIGTMISISHKPKSPEMIRSSLMPGLSLIKAAQPLEPKPFLVGRFTPEQNSIIMKTMDSMPVVQKLGIDVNIYNKFNTSYYGNAVYGKYTLPLAHARVFESDRAYIKERDDQKPKETDEILQWSMRFEDPSDAKNFYNTVSQKLNAGKREEDKLYITLNRKKGIVEISPTGLSKATALQKIKNNPAMLWQWLQKMGIRTLEQLKLARVLFSDVDGTLVETDKAGVNFTKITPQNMAEFLNNNGYIICVSSSIPLLVLKKFNEAKLFSDQALLSKVLLLGWCGNAAVSVENFDKVSRLNEGDPQGSSLLGTKEYNDILTYLAPDNPQGFWTKNIIYTGDESIGDGNDVPVFNLLKQRAISVNKLHTTSTNKLVQTVNSIPKEMPQPFSEEQLPRLIKEFASEERQYPFVGSAAFIAAF